LVIPKVASCGSFAVNSHNHEAAQQKPTVPVVSENEPTNIMYTKLKRNSPVTISPANRLYSTMTSLFSLFVTATSNSEGPTFTS
jgi:hypothetical protein